MQADDRILFCPTCGQGYDSRRDAHCLLHPDAKLGGWLERIDSVVVWKFMVPGDDNFEIDMPAGARILTVQPQGTQICLWALCDPAQGKEMRQFRLAGTGHVIDWPANRLAYIGTFQVAGGLLIFHLFEKLAPQSRGATGVAGTR